MPESLVVRLQDEVVERLRRGADASRVRLEIDSGCDTGLSTLQTSEASAVPSSQIRVSRGCEFAPNRSHN